MNGVGNARGIAVGSLFKLQSYPRKDQNKEYLVVGATYKLHGGDYESGTQGTAEDFAVEFEAISSKEPFRTAITTYKPTVGGPQTAVVTGPGGEEIFTDKYGRVKVKFHWDRGPEKTDKSSCWVRVSQIWAGKNWGWMSIPRIGQEVVVDFLEGDPDQPIISGRVYNQDNMPPYELPANKTQSGIKTRSTLNGTAANANELRFEDKKGSEQLFLHAEKNQDIEVENDETHWVGHDRKKTIDHDETTHVKHDRTETVDNNETIAIGGSRTETVDKDETISITGSRTESVDKNESVSITKNRTMDVGENETLNVGKNREHTVSKNETVTIGENLSLTVSKKHTVEVADNQENTIGKDQRTQVGKKFFLEAGDEITLKTGSASLTMKKDGTIELKGKDITIVGSGKIGVKASGDLGLKGSKITNN
jgi:type VI secretion system secreted protein VgrG